MERGMVRRIDDTRAMARFIFTTTLFPLYDGYSYGEKERERLKLFAFYVARS